MEEKCGGAKGRKFLGGNKGKPHGKTLRRKTHHAVFCWNGGRGS